MARHSSGQNNFRLSKSLTIALITILAVIALILWWVFADRSDDSTTQAGESTETTSSTVEAGQDCLALSLGGDAALVDKVLEKFQDNPASGDPCVTAEPAGADQAAATYLFAGSREEAAAALAGAGVTAAGAGDTWTQVAAAAAGVATSDEGVAELDSVSFPVADQPTTAAAVALGLAQGDEERAAGALAEDQLTTADSAAQSPAFATLDTTELPAGYEFQAVEGAEVPVWSIPLVDATEEQAQAGAAFAAAFSGAETEGAALTSVLERSRVLAEEAEQAEEEVVAPVGSPSDTLIVLDTSGNMDQVVPGSQESYHTLSSNLLVDLARETGGLGNQVALNNFSSPLNPGVTRGWRPNVSFPDTSGGNNAAGAIARFGTGGVPLTRAAAVAAASIGAEHSAATGREVRVVLVTTGSVSDYTDESFLRDIEAATGDKVSLQVVHVGSGEVDRTLAAYAMANGGSAVTAANAQELNDALRSAFGF